MLNPNIDRFIKGIENAEIHEEHLNYSCLIHDGVDTLDFNFFYETKFIHDILEIEDITFFDEKIVNQENEINVILADQPFEDWFKNYLVRRLNLNDMKL